MEDDGWMRFSNGNSDVFFFAMNFCGRSGNQFLSFWPMISGRWGSDGRWGISLGWEGGKTEKEGCFLLDVFVLTFAILFFLIWMAP